LASHAPPPCQDTNQSQSQLIIVSYACYGVGVLFSSRRTFFQRERKRDCFEPSQSKEYANPEMEKRADGADASVLFFLLGCAKVLAVYAQIR